MEVICKECKKGKYGLPVIGEGSPNARIMFVGEAPGKEESKTGRPFVGRSGRLLTKMLHDIGIERKDVYITSPVKYYPGKRRLRKEEIIHGAMHLRKQIEEISPEIIVLMGKTAVTALMDEDIKVTRDHGKFFGRFFITFHPAAALRFPKIMRLMENDLRKLASSLP